MMDCKSTLTWAAHTALHTKNARLKAIITQSFYDLYHQGAIGLASHNISTERPARPNKPELLHPKDMPRRTSGHSEKNRASLLHALAHIELNAIDLSWDMIARFAFYQDTKMPKEFFDDWLQIAYEEAKHFLLLDNRLNDLGYCYGDFPAHDGLWESAINTADNFAARLAIVPMVLEARGLDVTPSMIEGMRRNDDLTSADILQIIHDEEIHHVKNGKKWFEWVAEKEKQINPDVYWQSLVNDYFKGQLKPPFNIPSRDKANFPQDWYEPIAKQISTV